MVSRSGVVRRRALHFVGVVGPSEPKLVDQGASSTLCTRHSLYLFVVSYPSTVVHADTAESFAGSLRHRHLDPLAVPFLGCR